MQRVKCSNPCYDKTDLSHFVKRGRFSSSAKLCATGVHVSVPVEKYWCLSSVAVRGTSKNLHNVIVKSSHKVSFPRVLLFAVFFSVVFNTFLVLSLYVRNLTIYINYKIVIISKWFGLITVFNPVVNVYMYIITNSSWLGVLSYIITSNLHHLEIS